ncbi:hypothetical protein N9L68_07415 [bacterium]|nr:hypothetical protein [bacterium]
MARACGAYWIIEQPISSLFFKTPHMLSAIANSAAVRTSFPMSYCGHPAEKMTQLVGTTDWLPRMYVRLTRAKTPSKTPSPAKATARATDVRATAKAIPGVQKGARATGKTATTKARATHTASPRVQKGARATGNSPTTEVRAKVKAKMRVQKGARASTQVLGDQINTGGKRTYNGNETKLKDSQVYPVQFALAIVQKHWPDRFGIPVEPQ